MDDCREDEMDEIAYNWWTSAGSPKSVSIRDAFIAGWDAAVQALAKLTEERAPSRPDPNAGGEGVSVGIYEDPEMMLAFMPFFPNMWDETDDEARGQSMQEDNEYYESFER